MAELEYEGVFTYVDGDGNTTKLYPYIKTDKTLSVPGKAADAAVVGEAFADTVAWNLIPYPYYNNQYNFPVTSSSVEFTNDDGIITANGTSTASSNSSIWVCYHHPLPAGTYTLTGCPSGGDNAGTTYRIRLGKDGGTSDTSNSFVGADIGNGFTFTLTEETRINIAIQVFKGYPASNLTFKPMLVKGSHPRKLESSYQYLHGLLGPNADGSGADAIRYINDSSDENYDWVQLQNSNDTWVNWKKVNADFELNYIIKDGILNPTYKFNHKNGTESTVTQKDDYVSFYSPTTSVVNQLVTDEIIDVTNYSKMKCTVIMATYADWDKLYGVFLQNSSSGYPIATLAIGENIVKEYEIDISSITGLVYLGIQFPQSVIAELRITDLHFE